MKILATALLFIVPFAFSLHDLEQQSQFYFNTPDELYDLMDFEMYRNYQVVVQEMMDIKNDSIILDIGAGKGYSDMLMVQTTPGFNGKIHLVEGDNQCHHHSMGQAEQKNISDRFEFVLQYVHEETPLKYPDNYFDITYINRVLCSIEGWKFVLDEMVRVTKPGGKVIATCPDWSTFSSSAMDTWLEVIMKQILEHAIGEPFSFTKKSKGHFQDRGLSPVKLHLEAVRSEGYDDIIINGFQHQMDNNAHKLLGDSFITNVIINNIKDYIFKKFKIQRDNGSYYDVHQMVITMGIKPMTEVYEMQKKEEKIDVAYIEPEEL